MNRDPERTRLTLIEAKSLFTQATDQAGDAATACNLIGNGLLKLTEAITDMQADITEIKTAMLRRDNG